MLYDFVFYRFFLWLWKIKYIVVFFMYYSFTQPPVGEVFVKKQPKSFLAALRSDVSLWICPDIKLENRQLPVIDKIYINGGFLFLYRKSQNKYFLIANGYFDTLYFINR